MNRAHEEARAKQAAIEERLAQDKALGIEAFDRLAPALPKASQDQLSGLETAFGRKARIKVVPEHITPKRQSNGYGVERTVDPNKVIASVLEKNAKIADGVTKSHADKKKANNKKKKGDV